jgi:ABC-2 type transport system ATP-binding protein
MTETVTEMTDRQVSSDAGDGASLIECRGLRVAYGRTEVLAGVDLRVEPGSVYALLGRNGTGKSSLVRVLLGLQRPDGGSVRLFGRDPWAERVALMAEVGFVPEDSQAPPEMTPRALVKFCSRIRGGGDTGVTLERLARFGVPADTVFRRLSKGQRRQVELAIALAHRPRLLLLDDPSLGLDPMARQALFGDVLEELADGGTTVFLTTHDLTAVEGVADRVGLLAGGRLVVDEPLETLKARFRRLRPAAADEASLATFGPLLRQERPWGLEVVVGDWREGGVGLAGEALSLEEIFTVLHDTRAGSRPLPAESKDEP